jgi:hypothetical protein
MFVVRTKTYLLWCDLVEPFEAISWQRKVSYLYIFFTWGLRCKFISYVELTCLVQTKHCIQIIICFVAVVVNLICMCLGIGRKILIAQLCVWIQILGEFRLLCYVLSRVSIGWTCSSCLRIHSTLFVTAEHAVVNIFAYLTCETANRIIDVLLSTVCFHSRVFFCLEWCVDVRIFSKTTEKWRDFNCKIQFMRHP